MSRAALARLRERENRERPRSPGSLAMRELGLPTMRARRRRTAPVDRDAEAVRERPRDAPRAHDSLADDALGVSAGRQRPDTAASVDAFEGLAPAEAEFHHLKFVPKLRQSLLNTHLCRGRLVPDDAATEPPPPDVLTLAETRPPTADAGGARACAHADLPTSTRTRPGRPRARAAPKPATPSSADPVEADFAGARRRLHANTPTRAAAGPRAAVRPSTWRGPRRSRRAATRPRARRACRACKRVNHKASRMRSRRSRSEKDGRALRRVVTPPGQRPLPSRQGDGASARARAHRRSAPPHRRARPAAQLARAARARSQERPHAVVGRVERPRLPAAAALPRGGVIFRVLPAFERETTAHSGFLGAICPTTRMSPQRSDALVATAGLPRRRPRPRA